MKFGAVAPKDARGATAVHTIRQGSLVLKKGTLIGASEVAALEAAGADRVNDDRALGVGRRDGAELHAAFSAFSGASRSCAVISPMIDSAISGGDTAPIASPIGAWMRAMSA